MLSVLVIAVLHVVSVILRGSENNFACAVHLLRSLILFCFDVCSLYVVAMAFVGGGGALVHAIAQRGCTALIHAAANGHADCARLLLDAGADKDAKDYVRVFEGVGGEHEFLSFRSSSVSFRDAFFSISARMLVMVTISRVVNMKKERQ